MFCINVSRSKSKCLSNYLKLFASTHSLIHQIVPLTPYDTGIVEDSGVAQTIANLTTINYVTNVLTLILSELLITVVYHLLINMLRKFGDVDSKYYTKFVQKSFNTVEHDKCVLRNVVHVQLIMNYMVVCQFFSDRIRVNIDRKKSPTYIFV